MKTLISREHDYALRIVAFLAGRKSESPISVKEISEKLFISKSFTARIVHKLTKSKILGTVQGKFGGVFLKADPQELSLFDILTIMGFDSRLNACLYKHYICPLEGSCKFHRFFVGLEKQIFSILKTKKISEFEFSLE
jgi:Rrf2 family nitric oxide-sensitive transcriptional repressor